MTCASDDLSLRFGGAHVDFRGVEVRSSAAAAVLDSSRARASLVLASSSETLQPLEIRLRPDQVRLRLFDLRLEERRIEAGEDLSLLHERVEVGVERSESCPTPACRPARS